MNNDNYIIFIFQNHMKVKNNMNIQPHKRLEQLITRYNEVENSIPNTNKMYHSDDGLLFRHHTNELLLNNCANPKFSIIKLNVN